MKIQIQRAVLKKPNTKKNKKVPGFKFSCTNPVFTLKDENRLYEIKFSNYFLSINLSLKVHINLFNQEEFLIQNEEFLIAYKNGLTKIILNIETIKIGRYITKYVPNQYKLDVKTDYVRVTDEEYLNVINRIKTEEKNNLKRTIPIKVYLGGTGRPK